MNDDQRGRQPRRTLKNEETSYDRFANSPAGLRPLLLVDGHNRLDVLNRKVDVTPSYNRTKTKRP